MSSDQFSTERTRGALTMILERVLLEESQLAATTHGYVWRVRGSPVQSIKRLFSEQGRQIDLWLGEIVKHARDMGVARQLAVDPAAGADLETGGDAMQQPRAAIGELIARHESVAGHLREAVDALSRRDMDAPGAKLLNRVREFHETSAWMLKLLLESPEPAR